jgi:hypothetical protein
MRIDHSPKEEGGGRMNTERGGSERPDAQTMGRAPGK